MSGLDPWAAFIVGVWAGILVSWVIVVIKPKRS